jgi:hypothetical protein
MLTLTAAASAWTYAQTRHGPGHIELSFIVEYVYLNAAVDIIVDHLYRLAIDALFITPHVG